MEAKDPASGVSYYYNETTGNSQWKRPVETSSIVQPPIQPLPEDWIMALDETTGAPSMLRHNTSRVLSQIVIMECKFFISCIKIISRQKLTYQLMCWP